MMSAAQWLGVVLLVAGFAPLVFGRARDVSRGTFGSRARCVSDSR